jgi:uncharacterized protein YkwD
MFVPRASMIVAATPARMWRAALLPALFALALALCGCGGGGDSTPPDVAPTLPEGTDSGCGFTGFRDDALRLINEQRAAGASCGSEGTFAPAAAVAWNDRLALAAYGHSKDMADRNYFDHTTLPPAMGTPASRVSATGYAWSSIGENIAAGQRSVAEVVAGWMASPGHCRNIMTAGFRDIGMACARNDTSQYGLYYTLDLATPR